MIIYSFLKLDQHKYLFKNNTFITQLQLQLSIEWYSGPSENVTFLK
jgi:hypothetical protein